MAFCLWARLPYLSIRDGAPAAEVSGGLNAFTWLHTDQVPRAGGILAPYGPRTHPPHRGVTLPQAAWSPAGAGGRGLNQVTWPQSQGSDPSACAEEEEQGEEGEVSRRKRDGGGQASGKGHQEEETIAFGHIWTPTPGEDRAGAHMPSFFQPVPAAHLLCAGRRAECRDLSGGLGEAPRPGGSHTAAGKQDRPVITQPPVTL